MLTFLEVGFGGYLVQGLRVYALRAVPSFPQIALCFPSLALRPQPLEDPWPCVRLSLTKIVGGPISVFTQDPRAITYKNVT